jgi:hypothetical protein
MTRDELIEKIAKVEALFSGTDSHGEKQAAGSALERLKAQLAAAPEPKTEFKISIDDPWQRQLFVALCRRNQIYPYRLPRQRRSTVMIRTTQSMLDRILWPQFLELSKLLHAYLDEATQDIIARSVHGDLSDAEERTGLNGGPHKG